MWLVSIHLFWSLYTIVCLPRGEPGYNHPSVPLYWSRIIEQINTIITKNPLSAAYLPYYKANDPSRFKVLAHNQKKMCHLLPFYSNFRATPLTCFSHTWNLSSCHPQEIEGATIFCQLFFTPTPPACRWMIDNSRLYIITEGRHTKRGINCGNWDQIVANLEYHKNGISGLLPWCQCYRLWRPFGCQEQSKLSCRPHPF